MFGVIRWLTGPIGKWVMVAIAVTGWTMFHRMDAARKAEAECQLGTTRAAVAAERNRAEAAERIAEQARARADKTEEELAELEAATDEILETEAGACDIPDDVRERLRAIR